MYVSRVVPVYPQPCKIKLLLTHTCGCMVTEIHLSVPWCGGELLYLYANRIVDLLILNSYCA